MQSARISGTTPSRCAGAPPQEEKLTDGECSEARICFVATVAKSLIWEARPVSRRWRWAGVWSSDPAGGGVVQSAEGCTGETSRAPAYAHWNRSARESWPVGGWRTMAREDGGTIVFGPAEA